MPELKKPSVRTDDKEKFKELTRVHHDLEKIRERYEDDWEMINDLVNARRSDFDWDKAEGQKRTKRKVYDPLPGYLARKAADGLMGNTMNRGSMWFRMHANDIHLDRDRLYRQYAEEVEYVLYSLLRYSTFYDSAHDSCMDALTVGHTVLHREDDPYQNRLIYTARHPKEVFLGQNRWGQIDTVSRMFFMERREVVKEFKDKKALPEVFMKLAADEPYKREKVLHIVRPREDRDLEKIDSLNKKWESTYLLPEHDHILSEGGYDRFPYPAVWRWRTNTGEVYARSPSHDALPDIMRLQEISKSMIEFVQEQARPSRMYPLEMKGKLDMRPSGMTPYTDPSRKVYRLFDAQNSYPLTKDMVEVIRSQISEAYYSDVFTVLTMNMHRQKTATEVEELSSERSALLTAVAERFTGEYMIPVLRDLYQYAGQKGYLPPIPEGLQGRDLASHIEFAGPLALNQRRAFLNAGFDSSMQYYMALGQMIPGVLTGINEAKLSRHIAHITGLSENVLRSEREIQEIQRALAEKAAREQELMEMQAQASAYAQTQGSPQPGSPAEAMTHGG